MPPYVCSDEEVRTIAYALLRAAQEVELTSTGQGATPHGAGA